MTNKRIFQKAIQKAEKNGFVCASGGICWLQDKEPVVKGWEYLKYKNLVMIGVDSTTHTFMGLNDIIFSHDFAKAFWSEQLIFGLYALPYSTEIVPKVAWRYHLQKMILEKEPLKYLEKFL